MHDEYQKKSIFLGTYTYAVKFPLWGNKEKKLIFYIGF